MLICVAIVVDDVLLHDSDDGGGYVTMLALALNVRLLLLTLARRHR